MREAEIARAVRAVIREAEEFHAIARDAVGALERTEAEADRLRVELWALRALAESDRGDEFN